MRLSNELLSGKCKKTQVFFSAFKQEDSEKLMTIDNDTIEVTSDTQSIHEMLREIDEKEILLN